MQSTFVKHGKEKYKGRMRVLYRKITSKSQNPTLYVKCNDDYITYSKYKTLSKIMRGGTIVSQELIDKVLEVGKKLNYYYIDKICTNSDVKETIDTYDEIIWKGKKHTVCYITTAALVWLLSGEDNAAPFSGKWDNAETITEYQKYQHCAIAYVIDNVDDIESTLQHAFVSLNYGEIILDSDWRSSQGLTQTAKDTNSSINNFKNKKYVMKCIPFKISSEKEIEERIEQVKKYNASPSKIKENTIDMSEEAIMQRFMQHFNLSDKRA